MAEVRTDSPRRGDAWSLLFAAGLLSFFFLYLLLRIDPRLIYQAQEPVFFFDAHFAGEFLATPGGVNDLAARFLSQFFAYSWTGAILLVLVFWLVAWNTKCLILAFGTHQPVLYLHWMPSVFLLALHSHYRFPLGLTLGLAWALVATNLYVLLAPSNRILRCLLYGILQAAVYYVAAGQAFIFTVQAVLYEILVCHRRVLPLCCVFLAGLLPYAGASTLFILHIPDAYTRSLTSYDTYRATWLLWGLYAFFPVVLLLVTWEQRHVTAGGKKAPGLRDRLVVHRSVAMRRIQGVLALCLVVIAALFSYEKDGKAFLRMDYYAQHRQWDKVLDAARQGMSNSYYGLYQANRALYHCGRLCDELFSFPQFAGGKGLFMPNSLCQQLPLRESDVFLDLGLVNEAQHWAHEAVSVTGDSPWNLQRLVQVNLLKEDRAVAAKYIGWLKKTLWQRSWATGYERVLSDNNDLSACPELVEVRSRMPVSDFLVSPTEPERCLEELSKNTRNRMAFEYFMAYCLLEGDLSRFVANLHRLNDLGYPTIPRHFEEALLVYGQLTGRREIPLQDKGISQETVRQFNDFNQIFARYKRNKDAAYRELAKYHDTYWFYGVYYYHPKES